MTQMHGLTAITPVQQLFLLFGIAGPHTVQCSTTAHMHSSVRQWSSGAGFVSGIF